MKILIFFMFVLSVSNTYATELMCAGVVVSPIEIKGVPTSLRIGGYPGKVNCPTGCKIQGEFFYIGPLVNESGHQIFSPNTQTHGGYSVFTNGDVLAEEPTYGSKQTSVKLGFEGSYMPNYFEHTSLSGKVVRSEGVSCRIFNP